MKKILILMVVIMGYNATYGQQVKDLRYFYTDKNKYNPSSLSVTRIYYKDINNYFTPFLGQWKSTTGNQTFVVTLWKETQRPTEENGDIVFYCDKIFGHYQIFVDYGLSTQSLLYTSQINIGSTTQSWDTVILGKVVQPNKLSGSIQDVVGPNQNPDFPQGVEGNLSMTIISGTLPLTANWKIIRSSGMRRSNQPRVFTIPTNVILTKI
ncbi:DUF6705 family protein [Flavobacterium sp.]|uniref:DUF6705 family protein n=1 Tax=Flavobacterium sp. TaxID=239 RepID=UPI003BE82EEF